MEARSGCRTAGRSRHHRLLRRGFAWLFAGCASACLAQDLSAWKHRKDIYYDTSPKGAGIAADVHRFPVLLRLTAGDFPFSEARDSGQDLRFAKADGTLLPYEIDRYDRAARIAHIWMLADTLRGGVKAPLARMYWGNPAAPAATSPSSVFERSNGFVAVWHLRGQYPTPRLNAVAGGENAVPVNYDNDEQSAGFIGFADSLDGQAAGDHLQTWEKLDSLASGFTFSLWAYPTAVADGSRFMDFGNGDGRDNIALSRFANTDDIVFDVYDDTAKGSLVVPDAIVLDQWQFLSVTVQGSQAAFFRNGVRMAAKDLGVAIPAVRRGYNFLGKSSRSGDAFFAGKLDEPVVSRVARSADWIKLAYANQGSDQSLISFQAPVECRARFAASADTAVPEGSRIRLEGVADCSGQYEWRAVSGPLPRIPDPSVKVLELILPRVGAETVSVLEFSARFGDSLHTRLVRVTLRNTVPEPEFTLPPVLAWNGADTLAIRPVITNLASLRAGPYPDLRYAWTLRGHPADTLLRPEWLLLRSAAGAGTLTVSLCLDNEGPPQCRETAVEISGPVGARPAASRKPVVAARMPGYSADGRRGRGPFQATPDFARPGRRPSR